MAKKEKKPEPGSDTTLWMVTFGDLLMLLLTFFVLLLTMSSMDTKSLQAMFSLFSGASGPLDFSQYGRVTPVPGDMDMTPGQLDGVSPERLDMLSTLEEMLNLTKSINAQDKTIWDRFSVRPKDIVKQLTDKYRDCMEVTEDDRGVIITFDEKVMFDPGRASIRKEMYPLLDMLADVLKMVSGRILIVGHSDSTPFAGAQNDSNWDLSLFRALNVMFYFISGHDLDQSRFSVGGMGETRPVFSNKTQKGRDKNRRVEIIIQK